MRGRWYLVAAPVALLVVAAAGVYLYRQASSARQPAPAPAKDAPAAYTGSDVMLDGKIQAVTLQAVAAPMEGMIENFYADAGDEVYEGELIAQVRSAALDVARDRAALDAENARSKVTDTEAMIVSARLEAARAEADAARSKASFDQASKAWDRQKLLLDAGATPRLTAEKAQREFENSKRESEAAATLARNAQSRLEALQRELDTAKKAADEAQKDLDHAAAQASTGEVHSPVNGVVVARRGQPGEQVDRSMLDLFQIATDLSRLAVVLEPPPPVLARMRPGQQAAVTVAESPNPLAGQVKSMDQGKVTVEFANPDPAVKPGMTARVRIVF
jgi:HlyD family secretion protein